ncbi:MAG: FKBP-type peptidyl-prolyl cis-trans isomerase [Moraxellaceae bacterium]|jgi:FKBP-type peptidyl-prolyl cis-trans isomerase|nr:FKBP-type peptidyl-prolyl cis-trans isomerase [Moraxellaceae bacterium]
MKRQMMAAGLVVMAGMALVACDEQKKPKTVAERAAYSIGYMTGKQSKPQAPNLETDSFVAGFKDAYAGKQSPLSDKEMTDALMAYEQQLRKEHEMAQKKNALVGESEGNAYLAQNAKKAGVKTTASGLQYEVITEGKGPKPSANDVVRVHYEGKLVNGTVFDSSRQRGQPLELPLKGVIPGWIEGIQLMPVGSRYKLTIPSKLGYGEEGAGPIPPNAVLVFDVELLDIVKQ